MTLICLSTALTKSLGGVFLTMGWEVSFLFIMTRNVGGILVVGRQQPRFFNVVFTGLPYLRMHLSAARVVLDVSSWVE